MSRSCSCWSSMIEKSRLIPVWPSSPFAQQDLVSTRRRLDRGWIRLRERRSKSTPQLRRSRWHYANWVSKARIQFLVQNPGEIWRRHEEVAFLLACDGSEEHKLHFRDGNCTIFFDNVKFFTTKFFSEGRTILTCLTFFRFLSGRMKNKPIERSSIAMNQIRKTLTMKWRSSFLATSRNQANPTSTNPEEDRSSCPAQCTG